MNKKGKKLLTGLTLSIVSLSLPLLQAGASSLDRDLASDSMKDINKRHITCDSYPRHTLVKKASIYQDEILAAAQQHKVSAHLITAVITVESCFKSRAKSHAGAVGLMQLMPATASRFGLKDRYDSKQNIDAGTQYLKFLLNRFSGNVQLAAAAYNAGEGAVDKFNGVPPYKETTNYVKRVLKVYRKMAGSPEQRKIAHQQPNSHTPPAQPQRSRAWYVERYKRDRLLKGLNLTTREIEHVDDLLQSEHIRPELSFKQFL